MKNEKNEKLNKRDYSLGSLHQKAIFDIVFSRSVQMKGTKVDEITKILKLSHKTIYNNLDKLQAENKIFKSKHEYYVKSLFIDDGWKVFAEFLKNFLRLYRLNKNSLIRYYSHGYTFHDELETEIFNFGNMIGAFITYILVESLRPNEKATAENRLDVIVRFLQNAVDMNTIFLLFVKIFPQDSRNQLMMGVDKKLLDKTVNAYNNVYPGFSESLDYGFKEYVGSNFEVSKSCDHQWREVRIHKLGEYLECKKCMALVNTQSN